MTDFQEITEQIENAGCLGDNGNKLENDGFLGDNGTKLEKYIFF